MTARRRLRVAFLTGSLDTGGSERQMLALAQRLPRDRFEPEFVLLTHGGHLADVASASGIPVRILGWPRGKTVSGGVRRVGRALSFPADLRRGHYDIVDAWLFHAYALAAVTRPFSRVPVFLSGRRSLSGFKGRFNPLYKGLDAYARHATDMIVANSAQVRDDVIAREHADPRKIAVIRNGVELPEAMAPEERAAIRAGWGFGPDEVVAGCVANYKPRKGLDALVAMVARLHADLPMLRLVLVGEGKHRPVLEALIRDNGLDGVVRLHGHETDARRLYAAFDLAVLASEAEGLPNGLLEAAAAGLPAVTTAAGGAVDVVKDGENGLVVPVGDEAALAEAVRRLVCDPDRRREFGAAGRRRAETVFGMDRFVAETAAVYEELARRRGIVA